MRKNTIFLKKLASKISFNSSDILLSVYYLAKLVLYIAVSLVATAMVGVVIVFIAKSVFPDTVKNVNMRMTKAAFNSLVNSGKYHEAIYIMENNSDILRDTSMHFRTNNYKVALADCYIHVGDYTKAENILKSAYSNVFSKAINEKSRIRETKLRYDILHRMFDLCYLKKDYEGQERYLDELGEYKAGYFTAIEQKYCDPVETKESFYIQCIADSILVLRHSSPLIAKSKMKSLIDTIKSCHDISPNGMLVQLNKLAGWQLEDGDTLDSYKTISEAVSIANSLHYISQKDYSQLGILSDYCYLIHDVDNGKNFLRIYMNYLADKYEKDDLEYLSNCSRGFKLYETKNNYEKLVKEVENCCRGLQTSIEKNFRSMSEDEREAFSRMLDEPYTYALHLLKDHPEDKRLANLCFENNMFKRGLLLRSNLAVRNAVKAMGNSQLLQDYDTLQKLQNELIARECMRSPHNSYIKHKLEKEIKTLDKNICQKCNSYNLLNDSYRITIKDIQKKLSKKDIVVEFSEDKEGDLFALVLKSRGDVVVCHFSNRNSIPVDVCSGGGSAYRHLSSIIMNAAFIQCLDGIQNIYYSTSGLFNTINLSALTDSDGNPLCDTYQLKLLSNVRNIAVIRQPLQITSGSVALWGDINYDKEDNKQLGNLVVERGHTLCHLSGTKREIESIEQLLLGNRFVCSLLKGDSATEQSFKAQSGGNNTILHVATHGFFKEDRSHESKISPMYNSGLFFAGANKYWISDSTVISGDDGILRSTEISVMDLSRCELVVLSACRTGVGQDSDEGVYGLQRAFKLAGVNKIIMSLWSVDDTCTAEMMETFYEYMFVKKLPVDTAFVLSRDNIRKKYPDPSIWAAFVLID